MHNHSSPRRRAPFWRAATGASLALLLGGLGLGALPAQAALAPHIAAAASATLLAPTSGSPLGGQLVTITGTGFTGATGVTFGGTPATAFTVVNDTTVTATTPAHAPGAVDVVVQQPTGDSAPLTFTYLVPPTVSTVAYDRVSAAGGTDVTISGTGFTGTTGVTFGGTPATAFTVTSDTTITATTPAHAPGAVDVVVQGPNGASQPGTITYVPVTTAVITSVSPQGGDVRGGFPATITGTGLSGTLFVLYAGAPIPFTVVSDTTVDIVMPMRLANTPTLAVETPAGVSAPVLYTWGPGVTIDSVSPAGPAAAGTTVTLTGYCFADAQRVLFGGAPAASFSVVSDTTIRAVVPAGTGTVDVTVEGFNGCRTGTLAAAFTYAAAVTPAGADGTATLANTGSSTPVVPILFGAGLLLAAGGALLIARLRRRAY